MPVRLRATKTMGRPCARRQAYLTFAAFAVFVAYQPAEGQERVATPHFGASAATASCAGMPDYRSSQKYLGPQNRALTFLSFDGGTGPPPRAFCCRGICYAASITL